MEIYSVDAFTNRRFCGTQAGVAILEPQEPFPEAEFMRSLAEELRYSETAFVKVCSPGRYSIRYFTPAGEVDLCGHATVAAFTVLRERGRTGPGTYRLSTRAGELEILVEREDIWMDMAPARELRPFSSKEKAELYGAYGLTPAHGAKGLDPALVSTGLADILLPVRDRELLSRARQNRTAVADISRRYDAVGFHLFCPENGDYTARCRNFAPLYGIDEESATGTANGALTYYLYRRGRLAPGVENRFLQGDEMGTPSLIRSRLTVLGERIRIQIGGGAVIALRCQLL